MADPIPKLREAARNDDPVALTELAAALLSKDLVWTYGELLSRWSSNVDSTSPCTCTAALEAIVLLQRAIERRPGLPAAHLNLARALERIGLTVEARAQLAEAVRLSRNPEWKKQTRQFANTLSFSDQQVERSRIRTYIEVTAPPDARRLLRPYLEAQTQRLGRSRPADPDRRLLFAAYTYNHRPDYVVDRLLSAMQTFCSGTMIEPCAARYYAAGGLYAAGRKDEAAVWLGSIEKEVYRVHGNAGVRALRLWEEGLDLYVRGMPRLALDVFEVEHAALRKSGERALAAEFDGLRRTVRRYLASEPLFRRDPAAFFEFADHSLLRDVQNALASNAAIVRYEPTIDHGMVVFIVRRKTLDVVTLYHDQSYVGIESTAARMRTATDPEFGRTAAQLHDLVIAPILEKLKGISTLAIIRNDELADIPFGALFDTGRGQYLAERFTIVNAPSARAAVELSKRACDSHDSTLLAIGATRTQGEALAGVDREIAAITEQSLCARVLSGKDATPDAIQRALVENAVIHYGGHIVHRGADLRLLLAPSRGRDSLSVQEIAALRLDKARAVVLAGCGGAASGDPHAPIRTVADAFLMAGVPTVIATSYDLDDAEAPPTMRLLHTFLRDGDDAAVALRKTTLAELRSGRGVPLSVRFQAVGGTRELVH